MAQNKINWNNRDEVKAYNKARNKQWRITHVTYKKAYARRDYLLNLEHYKDYSRNQTRKTKAVLLRYYGNGKIQCVLCGFGDIRALSIDHIKGGGNEHRKTIRQKNPSGHDFYNWLIKNKFPAGYRTLCMNCQFCERERQKTYRLVQDKT